MKSARKSVDYGEVERFSSRAVGFWEREGDFALLHKIQPVRFGYVEERIREHFKIKSGANMKGLKMLDVGCGGGLMAEALAKSGASVSGLDASEEAIKTAMLHAKKGNLKIDYKCGCVDDLSLRAKFDAIIAMEIIEHVADADLFLGSVSRLLKPNGLLVMSAINRTNAGFLLGIVAAEYILGWIPAGTHDWNKFIRPHELSAKLEAAGMELSDITGMVFNPLSGAFELKKAALRVNYLLSAVKTAS